jgi:hypothetical protein
MAASEMRASSTRAKAHSTGWPPGGAAASSIAVARAAPFAKPISTELVFAPSSVCAVRRASMRESSPSHPGWKSTRK